MGNNNDLIKALSAPFPKEDLRFRPGNVAKGKGKALALVYIDSRAVQDRFDSVVGMQNWQNRHICYDGKSDKVVCEISVRINGEWITKSDGAGDTAVEGEKGSFSDALKRAAVLWGVGRYLYDCKNVWVPFDEEKKKFSEDPYKYFKFTDSGNAAPKAPNPPKAPVKNPQEAAGSNFIPIPEESDVTGIRDWGSYTISIIGMIKATKNFAEFGAVRSANKEGLEFLALADEKLRAEISEISKQKYESLKAPVQPPIN